MGPNVRRVLTPRAKSSDQISFMPESITIATRSPCGDSRANCKFCNLSAATVGGFPLGSIQTSCTAPELPLPKVSNPLLVADALVRHVETSFKTSDDTVCNSPLDSPLSGLKAWATN